MRGNDAILRARLAGSMPASYPGRIFVDAWTFVPRDSPSFGFVDVLPADKPELADWRFVAMLPVVVGGDAPLARKLEVFERVLEVRPKTAMLMDNQSVLHWARDKEIEEWAAS